jgi:hypothetical protein
VYLAFLFRIGQIGSFAFAFAAMATAILAALDLFGDIEMQMRSFLICTLGVALIIPSMALAIGGITCVNGSAYYCADYCSQCSSLGGFLCTEEKCSLPRGVKSGELHWRPSMKKSVAPAKAK